MNRIGIFAARLIALAALLVTPVAMALTMDELVGVWNMSFDMGQGNQTGTITVSKNDDGSAAIRLDTQGGGASTANNIMIEEDELRFSRDINAQGQSLTVSYTARLVDGRLEGSFELDVPGVGATSWTASKQ
ncbi:MAG: hypothetical protein RL120_03305 [Gammaproteobacteria bacterium]